MLTEEEVKSYAKQFAQWWLVEGAMGSDLYDWWDDIEGGPCPFDGHANEIIDFIRQSKIIFKSGR